MENTDVTDDSNHGMEGARRFPVTRLSAIVAAGSADPSERSRAFDTLVSAYWMPVYKYIRIKWNKPTEDARDLTQAFFTAAIEKDFFSRYDPEKARFRTFLRACLDGFVANDNKANARLKRGGEARILSLDFDAADEQLAIAQIPSAANDLDDYLDREWARSVFSLAVDELRVRLIAAGKETHLRLFERYTLDDLEGSERASYRELSEEFKLSISDVTNYLAYARREFRAIVLETLRALTATDEEYRREARNLLGVDPR
jgi:RNA polymerase sigma factor (sigma-70 family)